jgi:DNA helicase-2/ATP-dependent DNA helicase PcrA
VLLRRQAVLFRASHHADVLELALVRRNIPYVKYGGLKFLEAAHVRDLLALLRVLDNPWDEVAWFRVLQLLEGVGQATARRFMDELGVRATGDPAVTPLARLLAAPPRVPVSAVDDLAGLRRAWEECSGSGAGRPGVEVERLTRWLGPVIERRYDSAAARVADLEHLALVAGRHSTTAAFVAELTLDPPVSTGDLAGPPLLDEDWLVLSTVHSAKGGEWDVVHILNATDGMFPSDMALGDAEGIEEERRLLYVAVTRARDVLEINVPLRYYHARGSGRLSDAHSYAQVSRFLTPEVRALMDSAYAAGPGMVGMVAVDKFVASLWQDES